MADNAEIMLQPLPTLDNELSIEEICDYISNGGTLMTFCKDRNVNFGEALQWVRRNPARNTMYKTAMEGRKEWLVQNLTNMTVSLMSFDPKSVYYADGTYKRIHEWPQEARAALEHIRTDPKTGEITEARFTPRVKSIELLGKMAGVFKEPEKVENSQSLADIVLKSLNAKHDDKEPSK